MRTPSLFSRVFSLCLLACCFLPACASEGPDPDEDVRASDYAVQNADGTVNVLVCHVQSAESHEIEIGFSAVRSHLSHGDFLGPCEPPTGL